MRQRDAVKTVIGGAVRGNGYLLNRAGVVVSPGGTPQRNLRRVGFAGLDEKILADADGLALFNAGDVVDAVLIHRDRTAIDVILPARELDPLSVVELDLAALEGPIGRDFEFGLGADDGPQIAAAFFALGRQAGPGWVM